METQLRIAGMLLAIGVLLLFQEIPKINWRVIIKMAILLIGWILFCLVVHPAFHH